MAWIINGNAELDAQSNYRKIIGAAIATSTLMLMTVLLRGYVRVRIVKSLGADDWCIIISAITALGYTVGGVIQTRYGLGLPPTLYPSENIVHGLKLNYAFRFLYCIAVSFFKFALCFAYLRITTNGLAVRIYRRVIIATMAFTLAFMIYYCAIVIFACTPIHKFWDRQTPGKCLPVPMVYYSPAVITIIVDIVLFLLPIPLVLPLRMNRRRKIGLIITFLLGFITTLCSVMRLIGSIKVPKHNDPQYLIRWAIIEMNIGIITTSLPTLAPLLKSSLFRKSQSDSTHSSRNRPIRAALADKIPKFIKKPAAAIISSAKRSGTNSSRSHSDDETLRASPTITSRKSSNGSHKTYSADFEHIPMPFIEKTFDIEVCSRPLSEDGETSWLEEERRLRGA
ncbi:hypothetical protein BDZ85DRAFT_277857 [Elsinoe ampelina]|uniref:Rhodopsin domain-containing protein n=1 Tax=Elsinoe ampelina TaxID=302913 RepID=A0A6A6GQG4_9PEZI|nr:hypothetical protein BDZ85DRAFT_277857 [Elsinoe ampelina]